VIEGAHLTIRLSLYYEVRKNEPLSMLLPAYLGLTPDPLNYASFPLKGRNKDGIVLVFRAVEFQYLH
jgi:hypothetical protein